MVFDIDEEQMAWRWLESLLDSHLDDKKSRFQLEKLSEAQIDLHIVNLDYDATHNSYIVLIKQFLLFSHYRIFAMDSFQHLRYI